MSAFGSADQEVTYSEGDSEGWCGRMCDSFVSFGVGILCVVGFSVLVFMNESNYVRSIATGNEIQTSAKYIEDCKFDPSNNGMLVVVPCDVTTPDVRNKVPALIREMAGKKPLLASAVEWAVELRQWKKECRTEKGACHKTNTGGRECAPDKKICEDKLAWVPGPIASSNLLSKTNVGQMPDNLQSGKYRAPEDELYLSSKSGDVTDAFALDQDLVDSFPEVKPSLAPINQHGENLQRMKSGVLNLKDFVSQGEGYMQTMGADGGQDGVGSIRVSVKMRAARVATVAAKQAESATTTGRGAFVSWPSHKFNIFGQTTKPLKHIQFQRMDVEEFAMAYKDTARVLTYILRLVGLIGMIVAFGCIFQPLSVSADLLMFLNYCTCCLGSLLDDATQCVISMVSCCSGCVCFLMVFMLAWLFANPWIAVLCICLVVTLVGLAVAFRRSSYGNKALLRGPSAGNAYKYV